MCAGDERRGAGPRTEGLSPAGGGKMAAMPLLGRDVAPGALANILEELGLGATGGRSP